VAGDFRRHMILDLCQPTDLVDGRQGDGRQRRPPIGQTVHGDAGIGMRPGGPEANPDDLDVALRPQM
jgi:hypothetical protein